MRIDPLPYEQPVEPYFIVACDRTDMSLVDFNGMGIELSGPESIVKFFMRKKGHAFYSLVDFMELKEAVSPEWWTVIRHADRYVRAMFRYPAKRYESDGARQRFANAHAITTIYPVASFTHDALELIPFFDNLASLGIPFGSLSTMARTSWRRTLQKPVTIDERPREGFREAGRGSFTGGRREVLHAPAAYSGTAYMDLPAAYLRAMGGTFPTRLVPAPVGWYEHGIARARITVPDISGWHPIPATKTKRKGGFTIACFGWGETQGLWTYEELRHAKENGCKVNLIESWQGRSLANLFDPWLNWAMDLRQEQGPPGALAKVFTNRLWATFGTNSKRRRKEMRFNRDGEPCYRTLPPIPGSPETVFVASIVASRNRVALRSLTGSGAVLLDTDGGICPLVQAAKLEREGWKRKGEMRHIEILEPNFYRWKCMHGVRQHLAIDGCVNCHEYRWHTFRDGVGYDDVLFEPAQPFEEFYAA